MPRNLSTMELSLANFSPVPQLTTPGVPTTTKSNDTGHGRNGERQASHKCVWSGLPLRRAACPFASAPSYPRCSPSMGTLRAEDGMEWVMNLVAVVQLASSDGTRSSLALLLLTLLVFLCIFKMETTPSSLDLNSKDGLSSTSLTYYPHPLHLDLRLYSSQQSVYLLVLRP